MLKQPGDDYSTCDPLIEALGMWQIQYWCQQLECTPDELLHAVRIVGLNAEDIDQYLHHMQ